jgi:hypothetical protein
VRICGNCFLGAVGVPTELALLGLLWMFVSFLGIRSDRRDAFYWCCALVGIPFSPAIVGLPMFVFGFLAIVFLTMKRLFIRTVLRHADYLE